MYTKGEYHYEITPDVSLICEYEWEEGQEARYPDTPPFSPQVHLGKIYLDEDKTRTDLTDVLSESVIEDIENQIYDENS